MDINAAVGGRAGLSQEAIEAALGVKESSKLSERERIALEYADRVSATPVDVPDDFFARLARLFSEREIVELTALQRQVEPATARRGEQLLPDSGPVPQRRMRAL